MALGPPSALRLLAIGLVAVAAMVAIAADWQSPLRVALAVGFLLFVPGLAIAELLEIDDPMRRLAIAPAASLAIATLVATTLLYIERYSVATACAIVFGVTCAALVATVLRRGRRSPRRAPDAKPRRAVT